MNITTVGIDLAKKSHCKCGDAICKVVVLCVSSLNAPAIPVLRSVSPRLIGTEACGSAYYRGRTLERFGHTVRLMAPQFVKPYVKSNKNTGRCAGYPREAVASQRHAFVLLAIPSSSR